MRNIFIKTSSMFILLFLLNVFCSSDQSSFKFPVQIVDEMEGSHVWAFDIGKTASCVPLKHCATLSWLMNYKNVQNDVIQIKLSNIIEVLQKKRCEIEEYFLKPNITLDTKIECPSLIEEDADNEEYDECNAEPILNERDGYVETEEDCSIEVTHESIKDPLKSLLTSRFSGTLKKFCQLRKLKKRKVLHITARGNCCWKLYSQEDYKGQEKYIEPGDSTYSIHQPRSIKGVRC